jgi:signal transduction histidine kinase
VLNNIISNACKYSATGSTISVKCKADAQNVVLSISDEGVGINTEDFNRLFERYYRVENNNIVSGFGIGLYLCAEIIKRHDGKIWVESVLGDGSTFHCSLPISR